MLSSWLKYWQAMGRGGAWLCLLSFSLLACSVPNDSISAQSGGPQVPSADEQSLSDAVLAQESVGAQAHDEILQSLFSAQVVYLAETHTDLADHVAQLEIVTALDEQNDIAIAMEMFQRPFQPVVDAYLAGDITEDELIAQSEYETRWGYDWELYAPIIRYAKDNGIPLIALNTPAEITRKVAGEGLDSLEGDDLRYIPPIAEIDTEDEPYRARILEVFNAHGGAGHSLDFENFFAAQVLWDETMAEGVVQQLASAPERQVIVLAGEGHVAYGQGIPSRVQRRLPAVEQVSVRLMPADEEVVPEFADFSWLTAP